MKDQYIFSQNNKRVIGSLFVIGILTLVLGLAFGGDNFMSRLWANILVNGYFFMGVSIAAMFFISANYLAYGGWYVAFKRIPEAMSQFTPVAALLLLPVLIGGIFHGHHLYHWLDDAAMATDEILQSKAWYLNKAGWVLRFVIFFSAWTFISYKMRKISLDEDVNGTIKHYNHSRYYAAAFIVFFASGSSVMSWDLIMGIDAHWYSTLFGWYNFASYFVSAIAIIALLVIYLKAKGYLPEATSEHIHDLGKYIFGFSVFWTYLWFSQFLLIWYSNLGEETIYFKERMIYFPWSFWFNFIVNFTVPFIFLMRNSEKRNYGFLAGIAGLVLIGHWNDFFLMVVPGATGNASTHTYPVQFGMFEIGFACLYVAIFLTVVFRSLAKARMVPVNHPLLKESLSHHV